MFYTDDDFIFETKWNSNKNSEFDSILQTKWNYAAEKGYFRYQLNIEQSKVLPGRYSFLTQVI